MEYAVLSERSKSFRASRNVISVVFMTTKIAEWRLDDVC